MTTLGTEGERETGSFYRRRALIKEGPKEKKK